jgi:hypothetical protein
MTFTNPRGTIIETFKESFEWESKDQKEGFLAIVSWFEKLPGILKTPQFETCLLAAWWAQKDHEAGVWWSETLGTQIDTLQNDIKILQDQVRELTMARTVTAPDGRAGVRSPGMSSVDHPPQS